MSKSEIDIDLARDDENKRDQELLFETTGRPKTVTVTYHKLSIDRIAQIYKSEEGRRTITNMVMRQFGQRMDEDPHHEACSDIKEPTQAAEWLKEFLISGGTCRRPPPKTYVDKVTQARVLHADVPMDLPFRKEVMEVLLNTLERGFDEGETKVRKYNIQLVDVNTEYFTLVFRIVIQ